MTWNVTLPPDIQQDIWALAPEDRDSVMTLIGRLRSDPLAATEPYGEESKPVSMRTAAAGDIIAVVLVNEITERVSFVQITAIG